MKSRNILKVFFLLIIIFITLFIFRMSSENASESTSTSAKVISAFLTFFKKGFSEFEFEKREAIIGMYQHFFRKAAHFSIYCALGISVFAEFSIHNFRKKVNYLFSSVFCLLYAFSDEFHQLFVDGRSGQLSDVLLDFSGSVIGIIIVTLFLSVLEKRLNGKQKE